MDLTNKGFLKAVFGDIGSLAILCLVYITLLAGLTMFLLAMMIASILVLFCAVGCLVVALGLMRALKNRLIVFGYVSTKNGDFILDSRSGEATEYRFRCTKTVLILCIALLLFINCSIYAVNQVMVV